MKVQNFLCLESFLAIHENKEEGSADLHAKIFATALAVVKEVNKFCFRIMFEVDDSICMNSISSIP